MLPMEDFQMACALTTVGGSPLLLYPEGSPACTEPAAAGECVARPNGFTLRHEGQQGGAGLQSSGRAFDHLLPFALNFSRDPRLAALPWRFRPPTSNLQRPEPTRNYGKIELVITYSKQTRGANSNRN